MEGAANKYKSIDRKKREREDGEGGEGIRSCLFLKSYPMYSLVGCGRKEDLKKCCWEAE